jgi:hypothetical protein
MTRAVVFFRRRTRWGTAKKTLAKLMSESSPTTSQVEPTAPSSHSRSQKEAVLKLPNIESSDASSVRSDIDVCFIRRINQSKKNVSRFSEWILADLKHDWRLLYQAALGEEYGPFLIATISAFGFTMGRRI